ncbi:S8 family serine peptidase [Chondrinema litorale]|uniref:S8 family serine peptidase n=1 Tax=Chondrinema litorale TaxID=2994555 RepID=UPI0025438C21|nr:S8 family serine peptidase [Chondrinema litorale]UZR92404.1 S8 family serine peptidase [Chondrinema litorale]
MRLQSLFILFFCISNLSAQNNKTEELYVNDEIVIKVKASVTQTANYKLLQQDNILQNLIPYGVKRAEKVLKEKGTSRLQLLSTAEKQERREEFSRIYKLQLRENSDLVKIIAQLKEQDWIEYAEPLYKYELMFEPNDTYNWAHWGHVNTQTYDAWDINQGDSSIIIGIIDTGVKTSHPSLSSQLYYNNAERYGLPGIDDDDNGFTDDSLGYDFAEYDTDVSDNNGHGTEVSGMAAAKVNDNFGTFGTGYNTKFMPIKVYHSSGYIMNTYTAMLYAAENGCKIINLSLGRGTGGPSEYEQDVINFITEEYDALIVAAAGNSNGYYNFYPASYENVLSVAHSTSADERYYRGSYSYFVDLLAPGVDVPTTTTGTSFEGHAFKTGSSYASPFVAGIASLIRAQFPAYTAPEIAEILRMTADDVYDKDGNKSYVNLLGNGRVNAYRALTEVSSIKSVRAKNITHIGREGDLFLRGDTINISANFVNYFQSLSPTASVKLISLSEYATVIEDAFIIGELSAGDTAKNALNPFKVVLSEALPEYQQLYFKLEFSDADYEDYQYFFWEADKYFDFHKGNWDLSLDDNGRLGYIGDEYPYSGIGLKWKKNQFIQDAGLIIASDSQTMSDVVYLNATEKNDDFINFAGEFNLNQSDTLVSIVTSFSDTLNFPDLTVTKSLGIHFVEDFLTINYKLENTGLDTLKNVLAGFYTDYFLAELEENDAKWDSVYNFGYASSDDLYFGIKSFNTENNYSSLNKSLTTEINYSDSLDDTEKYALLWGKYNLNFNGKGEVVHVNSTNFNKISPDSTVEFTLVLVAGNNLEELKTKLLEAAEKLNYNGFISEAPVLNDTILCGRSPYISPLNGDYFKFYYDSDTINPFYAGKELDMSTADSVTTLWISNHSSVYESEKKKFNIYISKLEGEILLSKDTVLLDSGGIVQFAYISNFPSSITEWDFGNGFTSTEDNPTFKYNWPGLYEVNLKLTDSLGCILSLDTQVYIKDYTPVRQNTTVCYGDEFIWQSTNSAEVNFYDSYPLSTPISTGDSLLLTLTSGAVYYQRGVNASDSNYVQLNVNINKPEINLSIPDTALVGEKIELVAISENTSVEWIFDDKTLDGDALGYIFQESGEHEIIARATDDLGCYVEIRTSIVVLKQSELPVLQDTIYVCYGENVLLNPENGEKFRFYKSDVLLAESSSLLLEEVREAQIIQVSNVTDDLASENITVNVLLNPTPDLISFMDLSDSVEVSNSQELTITAFYGNEWNWQADNGFSSDEQEFVLSFLDTGTVQISLEVSDSLGCTYSEIRKLVIWKDAISGLNQALENPWEIYPVPAVDKLRITNNVLSNQVISVLLYDLAGNKLDVKLETATEYYHIDVARLASGIYTLQIFDKGNIYYKKISIAK